MSTPSFAELVGDVDVFHRHHFGVRPLYRKGALAGGPAAAQQLLSVAEMSELMRLETFSPTYLRLIRGAAAVSTKAYTRTVVLPGVPLFERVDPDKVFDVFHSAQTAVIVPVPAAEPLVGQYRRELDPADKWGVPAHVTVLYPFVEPTAANESVVATLASILEPIDAFDCCFLQTRWFGEDVLWLDPDPAEPFHRLTNAVWEAFPSCPPYGGAHQDVIPHLTVGERRQADLLALEVAEQAVQSDLPLSARIRQVLWIAGTQAPSSWRVIQGFNLRTPNPPAPDQRS